MQSSVLQKEGEFADSEYAPFRNDLIVNEAMFRKYAQPRHWWDWREFSAHLLGDVSGKTLLDYGCGMGEESIYFARLGARVTAIDASAVGIEITRQRAAQNGVADRVTAQVMDATHTSFPDQSFDLVHGLGILHHVGLAAGLREVKRVLSPGGTGVFLEPLGNVRLVEKCKAWLHARLRGKLRLLNLSEDEENLRLTDLGAWTSEFSQFRVYPYRLSQRLRKLIAPQALHPLLARFDYCALKVAPFLKVFAGAAVIHLVNQEPRTE